MFRRWDRALLSSSNFRKQQQLLSIMRYTRALRHTLAFLYLKMND